MTRLMFRQSCVTVLVASSCFAQGTGKFVPLEHWKAAVVSGSSATLKQLYSTQPPARITVLAKSSSDVTPDDDAAFWAGMKARRVSLNIGHTESPQPGVEEFTFEAKLTPAPPGRTLYVLEAQIWQQQSGNWRLVAAQRTEAFKLEQPLSLDAKIYPPAAGARGEIREAEMQAAKARKRVLVIFGADWCYDCHVLDRALERPDIAPVLKSNFEVVHVDVGTGDKNQDLMNEYQVPMSRGIPALAVLDSSGKLIYSQKNGEFERTRALGPEDLLAFLNKWKP